MIAVLTGMGLVRGRGPQRLHPVPGRGADRQYTDFIVLPSAYGWMESWWAIGIGAALLLTEVVVDKVPAVDTVNDAVQTFIRPSMGGLLAAATAGAAELDNSAWMAQHPWVGVLLGVVVAGLVHAGKTTARPAANVATLGVGAPVLSTVEDGASLSLSLIALFVPGAGRSSRCSAALCGDSRRLVWRTADPRAVARGRRRSRAARCEPAAGDGVGRPRTGCGMPAGATRIRGAVRCSEGSGESAGRLRGARRLVETEPAALPCAHAQVDVARRRPVAADPGFRGGGRAAAAGGRPVRRRNRSRRRAARDRRAGDRSARHRGPPRREHDGPGRRRGGRRRVPAAVAAAGRRGTRRPRRGVGEALRARAGPPRRRRARPRRGAGDLRRRGGGGHHRHRRHGGPHHHRRDPRARSSHCAPTSRGSVPCCSRSCAAPRPTAATSPGRARGCGCARAPTRSRSRSPSPTARTSTGPTSAA